MSKYRQVRVIITPGKHLTMLSVIARSHSNGRNVDRILLRDTHDADSDTASVASLFRFASDELARAADLL